MFKKLALVTAIAALPMSGFAMEALEDTALSDVTGQDGITLGLATDISASLKIHDKDGAVGATGATGAGALVIDGFAITRALTTDQISVAIDADGGAAATAPFINIGVSLPTGLQIDLGTVGVAASGGASAGTWTTSATVASVINLGSMTLGATTLNIQLGNEPQGNMVSLNTTITGGISLAGFSVADANSGGSFTTDLSIFDNGGTDLTVVTGINIEGAAGANGLVIGLGGIGDATNGMDIRMADVTLGDGTAAALGDIELIGLNLTGNLVISGH